MNVRYTTPGPFSKAFTPRKRLEGEGGTLGKPGLSDMELVPSKCGLLHFQRRVCSGGGEVGTQDQVDLILYPTECQAPPMKGPDSPSHSEYWKEWMR